MRAALVFFLSFFTVHGFSQEHIGFQNLFDATSSDSISCYRIPALVTAANGTLLAAIDQRVPSCSDLRDNKDINIVLRRSSDHGKTWSDMVSIIDFPWGQSASDPSFILDEDTKEIFLFYNYMDLEKDEGVYRLHVVKSSDNGKTWSKPKDITSQITKKEWHDNFMFITSGRGIQTRSGRLLHTLVNLENGLHLFGSDDHGKTFFLLETPITPANESKVAELADGSLMVNSRVQNAGMRYIHTSDDKGETWSTRPSPELRDPSCNASFIRYTTIADGYGKNRLLFANANNKEDRKNMTVRISYDEGKTWSPGKTIYEGEAAYSSLTVLANGDIGVFFEKDAYTQNVFAHFSLEWLTDGQDSYEGPMKK